jgi:hypothetical protein
MICTIQQYAFLDETECTRAARVPSPTPSLSWARTTVSQDHFLYNGVPASSCRLTARDGETKASICDWYIPCTRRKDTAQRLRLIPLTPNRTSTSTTTPKRPGTQRNCEATRPHVHTPPTHRNRLTMTTVGKPTEQHSAKTWRHVLLWVHFGEVIGRVPASHCVEVSHGGEREGRATIADLVCGWIASRRGHRQSSCEPLRGSLTGWRAGRTGDNRRPGVWMAWRKKMSFIGTRSGFGPFRMTCMVSNSCI